MCSFNYKSGFRVHREKTGWMDGCRRFLIIWPRDPDRDNLPPLSQWYCTATNNQNVQKKKKVKSSSLLSIRIGEKKKPAHQQQFTVHLIMIFIMKGSITGVYVILSGRSIYRLQNFIWVHFRVNFVYRLDGCISPLRYIVCPISLVFSTKMKA